MAWSPDGSGVYFAVVSEYGAGEIVTIGRYLVDDDRVDVAPVSIRTPFTLPLAAAVDRERVERLLRAPLVDPDACPPPDVYPSARTEPCAFDPVAPPAHWSVGDRQSDHGKLPGLTPGP